MAQEFIPNPQNLPCVDHIDSDRTNNAITNLRFCTSSQNQHNRHKQKKQTSSIYKGVYFHKPSQKWLAHIGVNGDAQKHLGLFENEDDAGKAYNDAAAKLHDPDFVKINKI